MPDYFLDYVELKDLDTDERMVSYVAKWLKIGHSEKHAQPFREFPVFRAAFEPLTGKIKLSSRRRRHLKDPIGYVQLFGEIGETGRFPVNLAYASNSKTEISFKAEAVSIGRVHSTRLYVKTNEIGKFMKIYNFYPKFKLTAVHSRPASAIMHFCTILCSNVTRNVIYSKNLQLPSPTSSKSPSCQE
ncbi:unnamed protein product [Gongylonema pulchrum]|uniref:PLAT domain-containing protein n=1 Tax=Gongylonema pulchrum TaxID=637853 RepID=A0A183EZI1_9BILA|nr:unnamed protein product [Gongylonema pulchrum]